MKKKSKLTVLLTACMLLMLAACGKETAIQTGYSPYQMIQLVLETQEETAAGNILAMGEAEFSDYMALYLSVDEELLEDGAVWYAGGTDADEISILLLKDEGDSALVKEQLLDYIEIRISDFYGYMPGEVYKLEQAVVATAGGYVALFICGESQQAQAAFQECLRNGMSGQEAEASNASVTYATAGRAVEREPVDPAAILSASQTGDPSSLSGKEQWVLDTCMRVIGELVTDDMTEYQKELAIHDWIIQWADYDTEVKSRDPNARPNPDNDNPYGLLNGKRAICSGYTQTFQLFMDMLEIECITVEGAARETRNDHAWNMVRLDGEWYCVDVTWDDPSNLKEYNEVIQHQFFNVTSELMRETEHHWDEGAVPEATAVVYAWDGNKPEQPKS